LSDPGSVIFLERHSSSIVSRLEGFRRVLLFGPMGIGKSTLAAELAAALSHSERSFACISGDPGSPAFGPPGAVSLGEWTARGWACGDFEPLCTLDAGRFRLPLIQALDRLTSRAPAGLLLFDAPGVTRGAAGSELLMSMVESLEMDCVLVLERSDEGATLPDELRALSVPVFSIPASAEARRPVKRIRDRRRTTLWDSYLKHATEHEIDLRKLSCIGTPPPRHVASAWKGRQIAFFGGNKAIAFGEVLELEKDVLRVRLCGDPAGARTLLVRDAQRDVENNLCTARPVEDRASFSLPADLTAAEPRILRGPGPAARLGSATAVLVNGVFGDPLLHVRLQHQKRSLLFDLGEADRLPARIAHQVTDVFISHSHIDHIGGFLWLLRSRIGEFPSCRVFGPPGLAANIKGFVSGIHWDRVGERGPRFEVTELHEDKVLRYRIRAGESGSENPSTDSVRDGILLREPMFQVRAATLDHRTPVLAFALETSFEINVRKERLAALGVLPGEWLGDLKACIAAGDPERKVTLPNGTTQAAGVLAKELVLIGPGQKLAYATDLADTAQNRTRLEALAHGAHVFFCEAPFCEADVEQAARTGHLTARACGEIATAAAVERLVPFHFSRRHQDEPERVYAEVKAAFPRVI
jgi:ribonuclease Z